MSERTEVNNKVNIGELKYVFNNKLDYMVNHMLLDWSTFINMNKSIDHNSLFEEVVKLLNVKENEHIIGILLTIVKSVYDSSPTSQISSMLKQYNVYEPISLSITQLFSIIKVEYENIVVEYINCRNKYIDNNSTQDEKNNLNELLEYWLQLTNLHKINTSSLILMFINPSIDESNKLKILVKGKESSIELSNDIKKFTYKGFCPKVPHERLNELLNFPVNSFISTIKDLDSKKNFPDYDKIGLDIGKILEKNISKPVIDNDEYKKKTPPKELENIDLVKWYVEAIIEYRKYLTKYSKDYEEYFSKQVEVINEITDIIREGFQEVH